MQRLTLTANPHPCAPCPRALARKAAPLLPYGPNVLRAYRATGMVTHCPPALAHGTGAGQGTRLAVAAARRAYRAAQ